VLVQPVHRSDIDGLRGIAVLAVVAFHAFPSIVSGGFVGVDVFFVISGYLISLIIMASLQRESFSFREFYARRIRRIFPALILVLLATYALGWMFFLPSEFRQLGKHIAAGAGFLSNFMLWQESGYFDNEAARKPLLHLWSLGVEEQFYLVWPPLLVLTWRLRFGTLALILAVIGTSFLLNLWSVFQDPTAAFYSPAMRLWELVIGGLLAYVNLFPSRWRLGAALSASMPSMREAQSLVGALLIATSIIFLTPKTPFPGWPALLPTFGTFLVISAGSQAWINRNLLSRRSLIWFGLISYPLYLWHWPLQSFAQSVLGGTTTPGVTSAIILTSILLAWLTYNFVEKPIRSFGPYTTTTSALSVLMTAAASIGIGTFVWNGLPARFPKLTQDIVNFKYDYEADYRWGTCFLKTDQNETAFKGCLDLLPTAPVVFLWGDSHAAHLYPGLRKVAGKTVRIAQYTASACPPIIDLYLPWRPNCQRINSYVLKNATEMRPDRIILAARWRDADWRRLPATITALKEIGITKITIVGPVPEWTQELPKELYAAFQKDTVFHRIPERMESERIGEIKKLDTAMMAAFEQPGVEYVSVIQRLCNAEGCLARIGDSPTAWDYGHFTRATSELVIKSLW
jgi:peptidoglycan/LPS O-acetylase OafA/YrhL